MCQTDDYSGVAPVEAVPATLEWKGEVVGLEPAIAATVSAGEQLAPR